MIARKKDYIKFKAGTLNTTKVLNIFNVKRSFLLNVNSNNEHKKFILEFVKCVNQLFAHRLRKVLKVYTTELEDFELNYKNGLRKIDTDEYSNLIDELPDATMDSLLIEESSKFAEYLWRKYILNLDNIISAKTPTPGFIDSDCVTA